jgi:hypothetical protein
MNKFAPPPYTTLDIGATTVKFHTYICDANGRKIGVVWGPTEEKVWTAALWVAAPDLLAALENMVKVRGGEFEYDSEVAYFEQARAAIAKANGDSKCP